MTCYVAHGVPLPPPVDHAYVEEVVKLTSKMWGQWCVGVRWRTEMGRSGERAFIDRWGYLYKWHPLSLFSRFRHPEFARLGIGPFIDELLQAVDARVRDESPHHLLLYAGG